MKRIRMNHHIENAGRRIGSVLLLLCAVTLFYYMAIEYCTLTGCGDDAEVCELFLNGEATVGQEVYIIQKMGQKKNRLQLANCFGEMISNIAFWI